MKNLKPVVRDSGVKRVTNAALVAACIGRLSPSPGVEGIYINPEVRFNTF